MQFFGLIGWYRLIMIGWLHPSCPVYFIYPPLSFPRPYPFCWLHMYYALCLNVYHVQGSTGFVCRWRSRQWWPYNTLVLSTHDKVNDCLRLPESYSFRCRVAQDIQTKTQICINKTTRFISLF